MCGICGVVGGESARERPRVEAMASAIAHRGPDDSGFYADEHAVLGHRRLSIIDLASGHQPLSNEDGSLWITFNGEIYNYRELRAELAAAGCRFRTQTDTEVLLRLYEREGARCLGRLRGMFAFAIWDRARRHLFAARDHFGQKPFFYAEHAGRFHFASEVKGLLAHGDLVAEPEPVAIDAYLSLRFVPPPLTFFKGIRKLPAGHWLEWKEGKLRVERYWEPHFQAGPKRDVADWVAELSTQVDDAVRAHMVSDVPVGAFLSGGIDSSVVVATMARHSPGPVKTFCVGSEVESFDERGHARTVAAQCGTEHHDTYVTSEFIGTIPRLVHCLDEPSDPIAACIYEVVRLASRHVKVVLGGDGGDEIFAGFDRYAAYDVVRRYERIPRWLWRGLITPAIRNMPESFAYKSLSQRARWLDAMLHERGGRRYARMTTFFRFGEDEKRWVYGHALAEELARQDPAEVIAGLFDRAPADCSLHRMIYADLLTRLPEHTLMLADRMSMAHSLETRCPLLDPKLAEFCATMPADLKIRRGVTKFAMREAARSWLPPEILHRAKQGFMFPVAYWLDRRTAPEVGARIRGGPLVASGWIRPDAVDRLVAEHLGRRADHHVRIWMLLNLDAWHRIYLGGERPEPLD